MAAPGSAGRSWRGCWWINNGTSSKCCWCTTLNTTTTIYEYQCFKFWCATAINISSSQGPTRDGRFKPDAAAVGTDVLAANGFDIEAGSGTGYGLFTVGNVSSLYTIDTATGTATLRVGFPEPLRGIALK